MKFQKLTPIKTGINSDEGKIYREAFDFVFMDDDLRNVAISGAYGAGKSSVFESYMHQWKSKEKIIHISLAHFEQLESCGNGTKNQDETSLEAKIINQLVHQIDSSKIKKTSFIARINDNWWCQIWKSLEFSIALLIMIFLVFVNNFKPVLANLYKPLHNIFNFLISSDGLLLLSAVLFLILLKFIFSIVQHTRGNNLLKKLSVKDVSIDLTEENTESFFDRYLTEIRYLFDNCGSTIVAIEDIDRYYSCSIFEKIRELNTVVNYDRKKPIRFFYIIKDDIFSSKDRTKFFDFIIPVVPIVDASNSYSILRSELQEGMEGTNLDNWFLRGLSIYIDDMRVLKNIINEFLIYRTALVKQELDPNKLLAIITYKNLFPKDFNDLQMGTGYLFALCQSRADLAKEVTSVGKEKLIELDQKIEAVNHEVSQSLDELGALYLQPTPNLESVNGQSLDQYESQLSLFSEISKNPTVGVWKSGSHTSYDLSNKISALQNNDDYAKRKKLIEQKKKDCIDNWKKEKAVIEMHIQEVHESHSISNLIDPSNIDTFLNRPSRENQDKYKEIKDDLHFQIIPYLIRNGIIDGNYKDYLTYFYDNELKIQDQTFIRSVFDEEPLSVNHKLTNPQAVLQVLESVKENNLAFLNFGLFFYVFDNKKIDDSEKFIRLSKKKNKHELITEYIKEGKQIKHLINTLNNQWDSFYVDVEGPTKWNQEDQNRFLQMELKHEFPEVLQKINMRNDIKTGIENDRHLFDGVSSEYRENIIENLTTIGCKLQDVKSLVNPDHFLTDIYTNDLYKISIPHIRFWLKTRYNNNAHVDDGFLLSTVLSQPKEPLSIYTSVHLDELIGAIISNNPTVKFKDNQSVIIKLLTSNETSFETKSKYTERLSSKVDDVSKISDIEVIKLLLVHDRVTFNTNNLLALFVAFEKTFILEYSEYLTIHEEDRVDEKPINSVLYPKELVQEFFDSALADSSLNKLVTEILLSATKIKIVKQTTIVVVEKAKALISSKALVMNDSNLAFIRANHPNLVLEFEKTNLDTFKAILASEMTTDIQEIVNLLESDLNCREQISLLKNVKVKIPYKGSYRCPSVKKQIIKFLLDPTDIEKLIFDPKLQNDKLVPDTLTVIIRNVDFIIKNKLVIQYTLFKELMISDSITQEKLVELFVNSLDLYSPEVIRINIIALHISPFDEMFSGKRPKFVDNEMNQRIMSILEKKNMASRSIINGKLRAKKFTQGNKSP